MPNATELADRLSRLDGKGYKAYTALKGTYEYDDFSLRIHHVQGDPFSAPTRISIRVPASLAAFPIAYRQSRIRTIALEDWITRRTGDAIARHCRGTRGTGNSGTMAIDRGGQCVLERSSASARGMAIEIRMTIGLPASGRRILGEVARSMFEQELPPIVEQGCFYRNHDPVALEEHVTTVEDQEWLRSQLEQHRLAAFVGDGSILPRLSGVDDRPMQASAHGPVAFASPEDLRHDFLLPSGKRVSGMGIPEGVTLIVGGGFHGKSTLMEALQNGVYNHIPGDGRERVVTLHDSVKVRAEDGRRVEKVRIHPFIQNLPLGKDTMAFSTDDASGSTSQAANIVEAMELGARLLMMDEDTSAMNFMVRDERMRALIPQTGEPIIPFIDRIRELYESHGVSTILIMGGTGEYFDSADTVILMDTFAPRTATARALEIAGKFPRPRTAGMIPPFGSLNVREPLRGSFDPRRGRREVKIDARGTDSIVFGTTLIDLASLEQLVDSSQTRTIGDLINVISRDWLKPGRGLREAIQRALEAVEREGLDVLRPGEGYGNFAAVRIYEVGAAINRMRTLRIG